jgi:hypothetical protein
MTKHPATWAWAIVSPVAYISGNPVWWPYWIFSGVAWACCALDLRDWLALRRAAAGVSETGDAAQPQSNGGANADLPEGWRKCEFCGCNTNAKLRACCQRGKREAARAAGWEVVGTKTTCPACTGQDPDYWTQHKGGHASGSTLPGAAPDPRLKGTRPVAISELLHDQRMQLPGMPTQPKGK